MRTILKISGMLSWFNLVVWGIIVSMGLLSTLAVQQMAFLIFPFLFSVIVLHSYAAIQLQRSIKNPAKPLSNQTPVGIRFIGMIAGFVGIIYFLQGIALLQNPQELVQMIKTQFPQAGTLPLAGIRLGGALAVLCGLCVSVNVILNFRLLRWYHFMKGMM